MISEEIYREERGETNGMALNVMKNRESKGGGNNKRKSTSSGMHKDGLVCWRCGHQKRLVKKPGVYDGNQRSGRVYSDDISVLSVGCSKESRVLDSSVSFHSTSHKKVLRNFKSDRNLEK